MVMCPGCDGERLVVVSGIRYAPGHDGPSVAKIACIVCRGAGEISEERVERIRLGESFANYRMGILGLGLREAAKRWGLRASELSRIEQGEIVTDWVPPGWSDIE